MTKPCEQAGRDIGRGGRIGGRLRRRHSARVDRAEYGEGVSYEQQETGAL